MTMQNEQQEQQERPLKAWTVETGITYWVAARDWAEALATWSRFEVNEGSGEEAKDAVSQGIEIKEVTAEGLGTMMNDDGEGRMRPLSEFLAETQQPAILACSEWP